MPDRPGGLFSIRIILASASSSIRAICPNKERRRDWIITVIWLLGYPLHLIVVNKLVPFESKQCCSQAPLIKSISLAFIHLGDCPAFRSERKIGRMQVLHNHMDWLIIMYRKYMSLHHVLLHDLQLVVIFWQMVILCGWFHCI